jgi:hypothetical protein
LLIFVCSAERAHRRRRPQPLVQEFCRKRNASSGAALVALVAPPPAGTGAPSAAASLGDSRVVTVEGHLMFVVRVCQAPRIAVVEVSFRPKQGRAVLVHTTLRYYFTYRDLASN